MSRRNVPWAMWAVFVVGLLACLGIAVGAYRLADYSWAQVVDYKSPFVAVPPPAELVSSEPSGTPVAAQRVVLVIVDGMREDVSRSAMPTLDSLRRYGSDFSLTAPQPSLSFPNWTTILTGASPTISGVTTNWHTGRELAPTLVDTARSAGRKVVVVGPTDFTELFGIEPGAGVSLRPWPKGGYLSSQLVDDAIRLSKESSPSLVVVHLPDLDEAGHQYGGGSAQYRAMAARVDGDISRLVARLQADGTAFVVTADHGHIDSGGHGGWELPVVHVPAVFAGAGIRLSTGTGELQQVAPTVSALLGIPVPPYAEAQAIRDVAASGDNRVFRADEAHHLAFAVNYVGVVRGIAPPSSQILAEGGADEAMSKARADRLTAERADRFIWFVVSVLSIAIAAAVVAVMSWRAFVAGLVGALTYYLVYETLFFVVHRYLWSLSTFNTETYVKTFMNWRLGEAAVAALLGVAVATLVYPLLRARAHGPGEARYLPGYLALAPATLLLILGTLGLQVAWFLWQWGAAVVWTLPDLMWGFKYDLDLVQMTAVGASALVAPLVAYLIGRYHPRVRAHAE